MHLGQIEARHARVPGGKRAIEARIGAAVAEKALLLEEAEESLGRLDELERLCTLGSCSILELWRWGLYPFRDVLGLLLLEDQSAEELLELLIRVIDHELLEAVGGEALEAKDVEHADASAGGGGGRCRVRAARSRREAAERAAAARKHWRLWAAANRRRRAIRPARGAENRRRRRRHVHGRFRPVGGRAR